MKRYQVIKARLSGILLCSGCLFLGLLLLTRGKEAALGVREGLVLCAQSVIPSLFLFLAFSDFLSLTRAGELLAKPFFFLGQLFGAPSCAASVFLLSLVGGYPVGARMLARFAEAGQISPKTAEKLLCCCVNASPAFLIVGVAVPCFGSAKVGGVMYGSQVLAAILTGILARLLYGPGEEAGRVSPKREFLPITQGFVEAVTNASRGILLICGFVLVFSAVSHGLSFLPYGEDWAGLLEVTIGCAGLPGRGFWEMLVLGTVYTAFGGVCVWMQISCFLRGTGIRMRKFILLRGIYVFFSLLFTILGAKQPRLPEEVFSTFSKALPMRGGATVGAAALLILLCLMLLLCGRSCGIIKKKNAR